MLRRILTWVGVVALLVAVNQLTLFVAHTMWGREANDDDDDQNPFDGSNAFALSDSEVMTAAAGGGLVDRFGVTVPEVSVHDEEEAARHHDYGMGGGGGGDQGADVHERARLGYLAAAARQSDQHSPSDHDAPIVHDGA